LDGQAAAIVMDGYRKGFTEEEKKKAIISIIGE
jgi:hypothetical protein